VAAPRLIATATQDLEGRAFRRWTGRIGGAPALEIRFPAPAETAGPVLALLVGLSALGFAALVLLTLRRRRTAPERSPLQLADAIARLDAEHQDRSAELSAEAAARYAEERQRLKQALERALARPGGHS